MYNTEKYGENSFFNTKTYNILYDQKCNLLLISNSLGEYIPNNFHQVFKNKCVSMVFLSTYQQKNAIDVFFHPTYS